jgi:hypothetical protein
MLRELADEISPERRLPREHTDWVKHHLPIARPATDWIERPVTRGECVDGPRPCPWAGCAFHLLLEVDAETGNLHFPFGDLDLDELPETCLLDVADRGGVTLQEVGVALNVSRERVRQIEERGLVAVGDAERSGLALPPDRS